MDTVDLTGPDRPKKYYPCEKCSKTFTSAERLFEHVTASHKQVVFPFKYVIFFPLIEVQNIVLN